MMNQAIKRRNKKSYNHRHLFSPIKPTPYSNIIKGELLLQNTRDYEQCVDTNIRE